MSDPERSGTDPADGIGRRSLLKVGGTAAGALALGAAVPGTVAADYASVLETSELGGRENYSDSSRPLSGNYEPTTESELRSALSSASGGEVVFVPGDASIEVTVPDPSDLDDFLEVPADVTLASDRGIDGSAGGLVYTDQNDKQFMEARSGARVTGIRIGGPLWDFVAHPNWGGPEWSRGIGCEGSGIEVDNCEIYGWGHYGVGADDDTVVHHCHVHHCPMDGLGYGVYSFGDMPEISFNVFNHHRHSIAGNGTGYDLHDNFFGGETYGHVIDMHNSGTTMEIYDNTVAVTERSDKDAQAGGVVLRGEPQEYCDIFRNWFYNPDPPEEPPTNAFTTEAIVQEGASTWANVEYWNNHYGSDDPPSDDIGAPVDGGDSDDGEDYPGLQHSYEFVGTGDEWADYYIEVEDGGDVHASTINGAVVEEDFHWISDDGTKAAGRVDPDERHAYEFDTLVLDVTIEGTAEAYVNGDESDLSRYPQDGATGDGWKGGFPWQDGVPDLEHSYEFVNDGDAYADYYIEVEDGGNVHATTLNGATVDEDFHWISDDRTRAAGRVHPGDHDAFEFDTLLLDVTIEGAAEAYVNGDESDLSRYPQDGATGDGWKGGFPWQREHSYSFVGAGDGPAEYYLEVEEGGDVVPSTVGGSSIDPEFVWISEDGTKAAGRVHADDRDAFEFDTPVLDVTIEGEAEAYVNGRESDLSRYPQDGATGDGWKGGFPWQNGSDGTDVLAFLSITEDGSLSYEFTVDGEVSMTDAGYLTPAAAEPNLDPAAGRINAKPVNDSITDNGDGTYTVTGTTGYPYGDGYEVDGTVTDLQVDDGLRVELNQEEVTEGDF